MGSWVGIRISSQKPGAGWLLAAPTVTQGQRVPALAAPGRIHQSAPGLSPPRLPLEVSLPIKGEQTAQAAPEQAFPKVTVSLQIYARVPGAVQTGRMLRAQEDAHLPLLLCSCPWQPPAGGRHLPVLHPHTWEPNAPWGAEGAGLSLQAAGRGSAAPTCSLCWGLRGAALLQGAPQGGQPHRGVSPTIPGSAPDSRPGLSPGTTGAGSAAGAPLRPHRPGGSPRAPSGRAPPGAALGGPAAEPGRGEPYANQGSARRPMGAEPPAAPANGERRRRGGQRYPRRGGGGAGSAAAGGGQGGAERRRAAAVRAAGGRRLAAR